MKRKLFTAAAAGLLSTAMALSAFAAPTTGTEGGAIPSTDGTDVYAGVIVDDPDAKIKVYVPTLFAFVVNGSVDENATEAITTENGSLLLPNIKVEANGDDSYSIQTVGDGRMYFENCSTAKDEDNEGERVGIPVSIRGSIKNEGTAESRNGWEHIGTAPTTDEADKKHYRLSVGNIPFESELDGTFQMQEEIPLEAPDLGRVEENGTVTYTNLDEGNFAIQGTQEEVAFSVEVGGQQNHYQNVEESAKIGNIVWTISYKVK